MITFSHLSHKELLKTHNDTLHTPPMRYGLFSRFMFWQMDVFYGKKRYVDKFKILELLARIPYHEWEYGAYRVMTDRFWELKTVRDMIELMEDARKQQDNEMYHLLIIEEYIRKKQIHNNYFKYNLIPRMVVRLYRVFCWLVYALSPRTSYKINVFFEDHAEHEYARFVAENPQLEREPFVSSFAKEYGNHKTMADVFRQISVDERKHKEDSIKLYKHSTRHPRKQPYD